MIYAILGPTCSGKSDLAEASSLKKNCPVINFDAFQVYKEINKGTAKPDEELLNSNRYFLYGFKSIKEDYNISLYQNDGRKLLEKYKNQDVVLVGGSGLYLKALLFDYHLLEEDPMPENYKSDVSNEILYEELLKIDFSRETISSVLVSVEFESSDSLQDPPIRLLSLSKTIILSFSTKLSAAPSINELSS